MVNKSEYKSLSEWNKAKPKDYHAAAVMGELKTIAEYFGWHYSEKIKTCTLDDLLPTSLKYDSFSSWRKGEVPSYRLATRFNLTDQLCEKMNWKKRVPNGYWTKEKCLEQAMKYESVAEWSRKCSGSRSAAQDNGWVQDCSNHMVYDVKPDGYWTKERVLEDARKYNTKKDWRNSSKGSFRKAQDKKWHKEATAHMTPLVKPSNFWNKETCKKESGKHKSLTEWRKSSLYSFKLSKKNNWIDECCKHMVNE